MLGYYDMASDALKLGADIEKLAALPAREAIGRFKYVAEENIDAEFKKALELLEGEIRQAVTDKEEY